MTSLKASRKLKTELIIGLKDLLNIPSLIALLVYYVHIMCILIYDLYLTHQCPASMPLQ